MKRIWMALAALLALACMAGGATARAETPAIAPTVDCAALQTSADFSTVVDAPTHVSAAKTVAAAGVLPAYCRVTGYVSPNVGIEMRLPISGWNGKFAMVGCGGFCGFMPIQGCEGALIKGYACIVTDLGHTSTPLDAKWAYNNLQAEVDFAFRATHVTALAGKAIAETYYGRRPLKSYYMGCSTGGRQGMVEAERFPHDFDGIIAGAPPINETGQGMALFYNVMATLGPDGRSVLSFADIDALHAAAVAACDMTDGVKDGVIGDPLSCRFDPAVIACKPGVTGHCLSPAALEAVRKIYAGARDSQGRPLFTGGPLPGSELNWKNNYVAADGGPSIYYKFMLDMFRYMNFMPDPGPTWQAKDFNWDEDYKRLGMMEGLFSGSNPDLRQFKAAGGKLLQWQGLADQSVLPRNIIDFYETATRTMGGKAQIESFYRLFLTPGMDHCTGGQGVETMDLLSTLEAWVEQGKAPDTMLGYHLTKPAAQFFAPTPADLAATAFTRPLYPYPMVAKYKGSGDINDARNFSPVAAGSGLAR